MSGNTKDFKVKNGIKPTAYHEGVGTVTSATEGYNISVASYDSVSFDVSSQASFPSSIVFNPDGTKMYISDDTSNSVYQYTLSTGFNLSTASYASKSLSVSSQDTSPFGLALNNDGTKMYVLGDSSNTVYQYTLSTAYDLSTASYASLSFSVASQDTVPTEIVFNNDGTKMYILGASNDSIFQYSLSTAFNVSTASYDSVSFSVSSQDSAPYGLVFNGDGTKMYVFGDTNDDVFQYSLSTAFDLSTASYNSVSFDVSSQDSAAFGIAFNNDGTKMYIVGTANDTVYQYSTALYTRTLDQSTGSVFEITPTSDIKISLSNPADSGTVSAATLLLDGVGIGATSYDIANGSFDNKTFSLTSQDNNNRGVVVSDDGTKFFVMARNIDSVTQYSMSTEFDVSTASYDTSYSVSSQTGDQGGLFIGDSGTKLYIVDPTNQEVEQYTLSTAWDINVVSYANKTADVSDFGGSTRNGITFKPDGTKMYITENSFGRVGEYTLSTAWDVSTASYEGFYQASTEVGLLYDVALNGDGTKMFLMDTVTIYQYTLSTAWDVTTASYDSVTLDLSGQMSGGYGFTFGNNGIFLLVVDNGSDDVNQYTVGTPATPATITYDSTLEFAGGTAPTSPAIDDTDVLTFSTRDGGTSYQAVQAIDGAR